MLDNGVVGDFGNKPQAALRADHQMQHNVNRVCEINQGVETVSVGVFDFEFLADAFCQLRVGAHGFAQLRNVVNQLGVCLSEMRAAFFIRCIEQRAIMKQDPHAVNGLVAVLGNTAAHSTGIVGGNAADHSGVDGCRVRSDFAAERRQVAIGLSTDDTGLQANAMAVVQNFMSVPVAAADDQNRVGDGLARETGAGSPEGHRNVALIGRL